MSGISQHPASDDGTIQVTDLLASVQGGRVATCPRDGRTYHIHGQRGEFSAICVNRHGAFCWHRRIEKHHARNLIAASADAGHTITLGSYRDEWPSRYQDSGGGR